VPTVLLAEHCLFCCEPKGLPLRKAKPTAPKTSRWDYAKVDDPPIPELQGSRGEGPAEPPYKIEIWGTGDYQGDGTGKELGYGKFIFSDGSYYYERWTGNVQGNRDTGTAVYFGGTGRFKGMTGGSTFDCILFGDRSIREEMGQSKCPER
jgi:hypothetical protein